jgi:hypothetical protein
MHHGGILVRGVVVGRRGVSAGAGAGAGERGIEIRVQGTRWHGGTYTDALGGVSNIVLRVDDSVLVRFRDAVTEGLDVNRVGGETRQRRGSHHRSPRFDAHAIWSILERSSKWISSLLGCGPRVL